MGTARAVLRRDVGAFDMEAGDGGALGEGLAGGGEVAEAGEHVAGCPGDDGGVEARDAGGELGAEGAGDLLVGGAGVIVIDAGEAVDLEVDEAGGEEEIRGFGGWRHGVDRIVKREMDGEAGKGVGAGTL